MVGVYKGDWEYISLNGGCCVKLKLFSKSQKKRYAKKEDGKSLCRGIVFPYQ